MRPFQSTTDPQVASFPEQSVAGPWPCASSISASPLTLPVLNPADMPCATCKPSSVTSRAKMAGRSLNRPDELRPYGMQRLLSRAVWDQDGVRDELRTLVCQTLHPPPLCPLELPPQASSPCWSSMKAAFPNGAATPLASAPSIVGAPGASKIARSASFSPTSPSWAMPSSIANCICPKTGAADLPRRHAAHIPEHVHLCHQTRTGQAHGPARPGGRPAHPLGGGRYRLRPQPRLAPLARRARLCLRLGRSFHRSRLCADPTGPAAQRCGQHRPPGAACPAIGSASRQSLGTKGERLFDWARLPVLHAGAVDGRHWLVVRRCLDDPDELAYYLVCAPPDTPLPTMVQAIGARWHIEEDLQASKALGLDQYEVRSYLGWYRHITLVLLAYAFLLSICCAAAHAHHALCRRPRRCPRPAHRLDPLRSPSSAGPSLLSCSHLRSADLSVVVLSAHPSVLGWLLSSSSPRESWLSLRVEPACPSQDFSGSSPGNFLALFRENSQEFSLQRVRLVVVLVVTLHPKGVIR